MLFTGYHGTRQDKAEEILRSGEFQISSGEKEWLGHGIYFYPNYLDAVIWTEKKGYKSASIIHSIVKIKDNEFIDFDTEEGRKIQRSFELIIYNSGIKIGNNAQANQCATMNYIWQNEKECKLMIASFQTEPSPFPILKNSSKMRREFCVIDNSVIESMCRVEVVKDD